MTRNVFIDEYLEQLYTDEWFVETEPLITGRFDPRRGRARNTGARPRLLELIMEAAFLPDEFGTAVPTEARLTEEEHVIAAVERVRAYWDGKQFLSRQGNLFHAPDWFVEQLPETPLDGELWLGRTSFQRAFSIVRRQDKSEH